MNLYIYLATSDPSFQRQTPIVYFSSRPTLTNSLPLLEKPNEQLNSRMKFIFKSEKDKSKFKE